MGSMLGLVGLVVSIMRMDKTENLTGSFHLSMVACRVVRADASFMYAVHVARTFIH